MIAEGVFGVRRAILLGPVDVFPLWGGLCFREMEIGDASALSVYFMPHVT